MPLYNYAAKNANGEAVSGTLEAQSESDAAAKLMAQQLIPLEVAVAEQRAASTTDIIDKILKRGRVKLEHMVMFCRQMAVLVRSGVPVIAGLQRIAETTESESLAIALEGVVEKISGGMTLTQALSEYPNTFQGVVISVIDAGENTGRLDLAFHELAGFYQLELSTIKRIKTATRYPVIVVSAIFVAIFVINFLVIPAFAGMFAQFKVELPLPTRMLMASSNFMLTYWPLLLILIIGIFIGVRLYLQTPAGIYQWDKWKLRLPIVGSIINRIILGRFTRTFAMILKAGVPLIQGITLTAHAMGNAYMSEEVLDIRDAIARGETLSRAAADTGLFTPLVLQMLLVGEDTGQMDEMMLHVAEFYEEEVDYDLSQLSTLLEPIILVILGAMVLVLALGVFLPMWNMSQFVKTR